MGRRRRAPARELVDPARSLGRDQAELGTVSADGIDQLGALSHQELAGTVQHQHTLALCALDRHEPHRRSGHCLADRLGVGGVVLLPAKIGLHIGRRHQPHLVAERGNLARPMVSRGARFHPNQAGTQRFEEAQNLTSSKLLAGDPAGTVKAVDLEDGLGEVEPNRGNLHGGWSLHYVVA